MTRNQTYLIVVLLMISLFITTAARSEKADRAPLVYEGWAIIKKDALGIEILDESDSEWVSMRGITMTDDGKKLRIMNGEQATPYELELIVITYEQTNVTVLKLALYEDGKARAITYIWGEPNAKRLGMNLRWMQAGLTKKSTS